MGVRKCYKTEDKQGKNSLNKSGPTHPNTPSQYLSRRIHGQPSVPCWFGFVLVSLFGPSISTSTLRGGGFRTEQFLVGFFDRHGAALYGIYTNDFIAEPSSRNSQYFQKRTN